MKGSRVSFTNIYSQYSKLNKLRLKGRMYVYVICIWVMFCSYLLNRQSIGDDNNKRIFYIKDIWLKANYDELQFNLIPPPIQWHDSRKHWIAYYDLHQRINLMDTYCVDDDLLIPITFRVVNPIHWPTSLLLTIYVSVLYISSNCGLK